MSDSNVCTAWVANFKKWRERNKAHRGQILRVQDEGKVRKNAFRLAGTDVGIAEQFPPEIQAERKEL